MVTVVKRGAAPVDPASSYVHTHQVLSADGDVWDGMLNQTDLGKNANKFYVLQLLHPIGNSSNCILYTRWGRVGENGSNQTKGPWPVSMAINEFKKQFKAKTAVAWESRRTQTSSAKNKYTWLERDFEEDKDDKPSGSKDKGKEKDEEDEVVPETKLDPDLQSLVKLMFNSSLIDAALSSMNYDANKLPLGKLAKNTILKGFAALKDIAEVLANEDGDLAKSHGGKSKALDELTGTYYSIIPHSFGRNRPTKIDTQILLKRELELVDALGDMEIASKLISDATHRDKAGNTVNPLDAHLASLELSFIEPVARATPEWNALQRYAKETQGHTHAIGSELLCAFRVGRDREADAWDKAGWGKFNAGERKLLWHGSRSTNFAGILKQGLRIAPPEAPVTGYMFGKGVYFADMMSKSANYCYASLSNNTGLMLLCETAVEPVLELNNADYNADQASKNANKIATKGIGRTQPTKWQDAGETLGWDELKGCFMPKGNAEDVNPAGAYLQYNEYIVYSTDQIRLRYLLMFNMKHGPW
ncbi:PARP-domain-containing protein [Exidia glandulosa HHB12029]|uniref:Poly [ADP-ribose] polymerase n=1 Tax=Exidia glandulosa HHB12029 TaxID=1314781 RepID=A0A165K0T4_EXIGL|nr:PARP-domain-containing protein [Exidia glandulosa HHB12029]